MTLDAYITKAKRDLDQFQEEWYKNNESDAETWPLEMDEGEWGQQELAERF